MTITDSNIDLLYQYHSLTQQVVQTERVDNSNFILKFEDIQNQKKKINLMETKKIYSRYYCISQWWCIHHRVYLFHYVFKITTIRL